MRIKADLERSFDWQHILDEKKSDDHNDPYQILRRLLSYIDKNDEIQYRIRRLGESMFSPLPSNIETVDKEESSTPVTSTTPTIDDTPPPTPSLFSRLLRRPKTSDAPTPLTPQTILNLDPSKVEVLKNDALRDDVSEDSEMFKAELENVNKVVADNTRAINSRNAAPLSIPPTGRLELPPWTGSPRLPKVPPLPPPKK